MKIFSALGLACLAVFALSGCETEEDRKLARAQACLDQASTSSQADTCISIVSGLTSSQAYLIRCSAHFVAQGFNVTRMTRAFEDINDTSQAGNGTGALLSYMIFDDALTAHTATITQTDCNSSGVQSMLELSKAVGLATTIVNLGGSAINPNDLPATLQANINVIVAANDPTNNAVLGNLAVSLESTFCGPSSSYGGTDPCNTLQSAISGGANAAAIGAALMALIDR